MEININADEKFVKCKDLECDLNFMCLRFTTPDEENQDYFLETPLINDECEMFLAQNN